MLMTIGHDRRVYAEPACFGHTGIGGTLVWLVERTDGKGWGVLWPEPEGGGIGGLWFDALETAWAAFCEARGVSR